MRAFIALGLLVLVAGAVASDGFGLFPLLERDNGGAASAQRAAALYGKASAELDRATARP